MADKKKKKNRIRAAIKANDNQEITGPVLQQTLLDIVDELDINPELQELQQAISSEAQTRQSADTQLDNLITGIKNNIDNGYVYAGVAVPSTNPVSGKVFYVAIQAGTYTNFGDTVVIEGITILKYNGTSWVKEEILLIDDKPTAGSDNPVKSGGVADVIGYKKKYVSDGSVSGYFDTSDGVTPVADSSYRTTDYIPLTNKTFKRGWSVGYVYLYDSNKQYLGYKDFVYTQLIEIDIAFSFVKLIFPATTTQENVYIQYSDYSKSIQEQLDEKVEGTMSQTLGNSKTAVVSQNVTNNVYEELKSFTQIVGFNTKENVYEDSISGYLNTSDGVSVVSDSGYRTTDFIEIHSPVVRRNWHGGYVYYYDSSKHYLGYIDVVGSEDDEHSYLINTKAIENAVYLRLVFYASFSEDRIYIEYNQLTPNYLSVQIENIKNSNRFVNGNVKIICIGDSITHGDYGSNPPGTPDDHYECYPYFVSLLLGKSDNYKRGWVSGELNQDFSVMNLGVNGATPKSWYNNYWSAYSFLFNSENNEKIFVPIMFGANCEFTDTVDTDTPSSDTEIGYYKRIIENIMSLSGGKAQIVLLPPTFADPIRMPANSHNAIVDNPIVHKLAKFYNLPFIDTYYEMGISSINTNVYQPVDGLHLGLIGYSKLGSFLLSQFNSVLSYQIL